MIDYEIKRVPTMEAKEYIHKHHYSHGCHNRPSPCYGLYDSGALIGVLMFATPCSERVRASVFGSEYKDSVTELHRLHIMDCTPKNTESWFISRALKMLKIDKPQIKAVLSFADTTEGHTGIIYQATNAYNLGVSTTKTTFYMDETGKLRHPRQCGVNITPTMAKEKGWTPVRRGAKIRYLFLLPNSKGERRKLIKMCRYDLTAQKGRNSYGKKKTVDR